MLVSTGDIILTSNVHLTHKLFLNSKKSLSLKETTIQYTTTNSPTFQQGFQKHVDNLYDVMTQLGNPFNNANGSKELIQLGTKDVMGDDAVQKVFQVEVMEKNQFKEFRNTRILTDASNRYSFKEK